QDRDAAARTVLVEASGKETRGAGTAAATIKASLAPADDGATLVNMHTTMNVTGRPAQFGRGVMVEVGGKLVDKFAENLAQQPSADAAAPAAADTADTADTAAEPGVTDTPAGDAEAAGGAAAATASPQTAAAPAAPAREDSLNIVRLVGPALLKRVVPVAAIAAALALAGRKLRRSIRRGGKD